ncbi:MAG: hypothetical protein OEX02_02785 [Cyclobacteriaceae bacterium]|nr:hypothetical protein [Cyclobacteriaceae bacterium]
MYKIYVILMLLSCFVGGNCQIITTADGTRGAAMGGALAVSGQAEAGIINPAGIYADFSRGVIALAGRNYYGLDGLYWASLRVVRKFKPGTFSLAMHHNGYSGFNIREVSLSWAGKAGIATLGLAGGVKQVYVAGVGTRFLYSLDFGGIVDLSEKIKYGAYALNLNHPIISKDDREYWPLVLVVGMEYTPHSKVVTVLNVRESFNSLPVVHAGVEYNLIRLFWLRTGASSRPVQGHYGLGFQAGKWMMDYVCRSDLKLGSSHQWSVLFSF